ncbi:hypothetical protein EDD15DRAFT_2521249 [Pisolithus albus]|nr:hypothetical protein EDD15DRAFT_2521249 [Pisolithus albus]
MCGTAPTHFRTMHGIRDLPADCVIVCQWDGCAGRILRSFVRHLRMVHLGHGQTSHGKATPLFHKKAALDSTATEFRQRFFQYVSVTNGFSLSTHGTSLGNCCVDICWTMRFAGEVGHLDKGVVLWTNANWTSDGLGLVHNTGKPLLSKSYRTRATSKRSPRIFPVKCRRTAIDPRIWKILRTTSHSKSTFSVTTKTYAGQEFASARDACVTVTSQSAEREVHAHHRARPYWKWSGYNILEWGSRKRRYYSHENRVHGRAMSAGKTPVNTMYARVHYGGVNVHPASWISFFASAACSTIPTFDNVTSMPGLPLLPSHLAPVVPALEAQQYALRLAVPYIPHGLGTVAIRNIPCLLVCPRVIRSLALQQHPQYNA